jgi:hypothetical protein
MSKYLQYHSESDNIENNENMPWRRRLVESSPPDTEEIGTMCREIKSRLGVWWQLLQKKLRCRIHRTLHVLFKLACRQHLRNL